VLLPCTEIEGGGRRHDRSRNFDLSPTPQFNPNSVNRTATYKVKLNDGRTGEIRLRNYTISTRTEKWNIQFNGDGALE
jgi:hypothetical protein